MVESSSLWRVVHCNVSETNQEAHNIVSELLVLLVLNN